MATEKGTDLARNSRLSLYTSYFLSFLFILLGGGVIFISSFSNFVPSVLSSSAKKTTIIEPIRLVKPSKLYIPKISKVLDISNGEVVDNRWVISANGVSFLTSSALPGSLGNSVFYGHNRTDILGNLPNLSKEDPIYIVMSDGEIYKYLVFEKREIKPTDVDILNKTSDSRLTIYTCSGFLDQARFVVLAKRY